MINPTDVSSLYNNSYLEEKNKFAFLLLFKINKLRYSQYGIVKYYYQSTNVLLSLYFLTLAGILGRNKPALDI